MYEFMVWKKGKEEIQGPHKEGAIRMIRIRTLRGAEFLDALSMPDVLPV